MAEDPVPGLNVLRLGLSAVKTTAEPLAAASYVFQHRPPRDLSGLEDQLLNHLAAVEDVLAHVRRMKIALARDQTPIERSIHGNPPGRQA